ncbi:MAG: hypothetical protein M3Z23_13770 [Acidobacteriota bacterium]|nr:hypothetical protein [Acidobacteriota bacterium]
MNLEDELRSALRREEPRRDLSRDWASRPARTRVAVRWKSFAAMAALLLLILLPYRAYERRQARGREAKQKLVLALELAGSRLHRVQRILRNNSL